MQDESRPVAPVQSRFGGLNPAGRAIEAMKQELKEKMRAEPRENKLMSRQKRIIKASNGSRKQIEANTGR